MHPEGVGENATVRIAPPADAVLVSALLFEFNGEALSPDDLRDRMEQLRDRETVFLGEVADQTAGLLILRTVPTLSDLED